MKFKKLLIYFVSLSFSLTIATSSPSQNVSAASVSAQSYDFAVTDLKLLTTNPIREENEFKVGVTYNYYAINRGYWESSSDDWIDCTRCKGSGGLETKIPVLCHAPSTPFCQKSCDGYDYQCTTCWKVQTSHEGKREYCPHAGISGTLIVYDVCMCRTTTKETGWKPCAPCDGYGEVLCRSCDGEGGKWKPGKNEWVRPSRPSEGYTQIDFLIDGVVQTYATKDIIVTINRENASTASNGTGWEVWGSCYMEVTLNAGENIGQKKVDARINWENRTRETDANNNIKSIQASVIPATNLTVELIEPNAVYRTDTEVMTTFLIHNEQDIGALNITPKHKLTAEFKALDAVSGAVVATGTKTDIVIPKEGTNIVYFKWRVPADYKQSTIKLRCDINTTKIPGSAGVPGVNETNYADNFAVGSNTVKSGAVSQTPDTKLEYKTPADFDPTAQLPTNDNSHNMTSAAWEEWQWENNWYAKKSNSASLSVSASLTLDPHGGYQSTDSTHGITKPVTRSGYGINAKVISQNTMSNADMVTKVQRCESLFKEFNYISAVGKCKTLEPTASSVNQISFEFHKTDTSVDRCRVHYSPIWAPNGQYPVSFVVSDYWTPSGMISGYTTDYIIIEGSMYDDWSSIRG